MSILASAGFMPCNVTDPVPVCSPPADNSKVHAASTPIQTNDYDCGMYVLGKILSCQLLGTLITAAARCAVGFTGKHCPFVCA